MSTTLHSFMDIFKTEFEADGEVVQLQKIAIPLIQRDYAQGRIDGDVNRVCLYKVLEFLFVAAILFIAWICPQRWW